MTTKSEVKVFSQYYQDLRKRYSALWNEILEAEEVIENLVQEGFDPFEIPARTTSLTREEYVRERLIVNTLKLTTGPNAKQKCRDYLVSLGIHNEDGSLSENYGGEKIKSV